MFEQTVDIERIEQIINLFGNFDENIKRIEKKYKVSITSHGSQIRVRGDVTDVMNAVRTIEGLLVMINKGEQITDQSIEYVSGLVEDGEDDRITAVTDADCICITSKGKPVKPKTIGQRQYAEAIKKNTITIGVGPAGTGKTYLAVASAVSAFRAKTVNRIILTRPAVEAGEKLGFLPGDLQQKVDPYLRPLYDALFDLFGFEKTQRLIEKQVIEIAPLAYMRGRTLNNAFVILDEAQNTTVEQMKMFLTRIGFGTRAVITGDVTQVDLPRGVRSGLAHASRVLENVRGIAMVHFSAADVVRHPLVGAIVRAYDAYEAREKEEEKVRRAQLKAEAEN